jgi:hypothetical protein
MGSALRHEPRPAHGARIDHRAQRALRAARPDRRSGRRRGRAPQLADDVVHLKGLRLDPAARRVGAGEHEIELWDSEFRMLHFFIAVRSQLAPKSPFSPPAASVYLPRERYVPLVEYTTIIQSHRTRKEAN